MAGLLKFAASTCPLIWKQPIQLSKPASRLRTANYSTDDGTSLDYSSLKPVDLDFIKFDGASTRRPAPILILHGLFVMFRFFFVKFPFYREN